MKSIVNRGRKFQEIRRELDENTAKENFLRDMFALRPGSEAWDRLSDEERNAVYASYKAINETPGMTPGVQMAPPEDATTVRVQDGKTLCRACAGERRIDRFRDGQRAPSLSGHSR